MKSSIDKLNKELIQKVLDNDEKSIIKFITSVSGFFDKNEIFRFDERFTSKIAKKSLISIGVKKKLRSDKYLVDKISASIILQDYLQSLNINS